MNNLVSKTIYNSMIEGLTFYGDAAEFVIFMAKTVNKQTDISVDIISKAYEEYIQIKPPITEFNYIFDYRYTILKKPECALSRFINIMENLDLTKYNYTIINLNNILHNQKTITFNIVDTNINIKINFVLRFFRYYKDNNSCLLVNFCDVYNIKCIYHGYKKKTLFEIFRLNRLKNRKYNGILKIKDIY